MVQIAHHLLCLCNKSTSLAFAHGREQVPAPLIPKQQPPLVMPPVCIYLKQHLNNIRNNKQPLYFNIFIHRIFYK